MPVCAAGISNFSASNLIFIVSIRKFVGRFSLISLARILSLPNNTRDLLDENAGPGYLVLFSQTNLLMAALKQDWGLLSHTNTTSLTL